MDKGFIFKSGVNCNNWKYDKIKVMLVENVINKLNKEKRNNFYERYIDVLKNYILVNDYYYKL